MIVFRVDRGLDLDLDVGLALDLGVFADGDDEGDDGDGYRSGKRSGDDPAETARSRNGEVTRASRGKGAGEGAGNVERWARGDAGRP